MASVRKKGKVWYFRYTDANGVQRERPGCSDKRETEAMLADAIAETAKIRSGYIDTKDAAYRFYEIRPLTEHIDAWQANLVAKGSTTKHAEHTSNRFRRLAAMLLGAKEALVDHRRLLPKDRGDVARKMVDAIAPARLSGLTRDKVQDAIARFKAAGWSLQTCNHYRASAKAFSKWCSDSDRTREDVLHGVKGFNVKEDRRHDRRTVSLDELRKLIETAQWPADPRHDRTDASALLPRGRCLGVAIFGDCHNQARVVRLGGPERHGRCRLHQERGYRDANPSERPGRRLGRLRGPAARWDPDLSVAGEQGSEDASAGLGRAGIVYEDASGLFFDFHSLRCQTATLADQAGISPRVVQKIMRHSSLELTGRYTRPRAVDIEAAASMLPSLKPEGSKPEALAATGTDGRPISRDFSLILPYSGDAEGRSGTVAGEMNRLDGSTMEVRLSLKKRP